MKTMRTSALLVLPLLAAACAPMEGDGEIRTRPPAGECEASEAQAMLGQRASADVGAALLERTGATILRWVPPRTAVTMDFRPERLTVSYDDDYVIDRISCG